MPNVSPNAILDFWFSDTVRPLRFQKDGLFDQSIRDNFHTSYEAAMAGELAPWRTHAPSCLALIILLDQFPRNMFRDTPQAFASDPQACELTKHALKQEFNDELDDEHCVFLYMPLMHSEVFADQELCVQLFERLGRAENLRFAMAHRDIIERFGRFPHRNAILGRDSTVAELEFLQQPGSSF